MHDRNDRRESRHEVILDSAVDAKRGDAAVCGFGWARSLLKAADC